MKIDLSTRGLAHASATHPWVAIGAWVALIAVALALNVTLLDDALTTEFTLTNNPDSMQANTLLEDRLHGPRKIRDIVLVRSASLTVDDAAFQERVTELSGKILGLGTDTIQFGFNYYTSGDESLVSEDRHTTIIPLIMAGTIDDATENVTDLVDIVDEETGKDGFEVFLVGEASVAAESNELATSDIEQGERFGVPVALIILLILFGAVVAALLPLLLAVIAIVVALGATAVVGLAFELVFFVTLMISMIGLAVGIDYSLIVVSRFREEMRSGKDTIEAITRTGETASRTVLFSGVTVVLALIGMLVIPSNIYQALGTGAILVVLAAVAAALTLLPAILRLLGPRINLLRLPFLSRNLERKGTEPAGGGFWDWVTHMVMGHPVVALVIVAGLLIAAAIPLFNMNTGFNGVDSFPDSAKTKEAFFLLDEEFSFGVAAPTEIVVDGDVNSVAVLAARDRLTDMLAQDSEFVGEPTWETNEAGDLGLLSVAVAGETASDEAVSAVRRLRNDYIPEAFAGVDAEVLVTGFTAFNIAFFDVVDTYTPIVFAVVLGLSFILLTIAFRSLVVPVKAIIMNLLSVGAAYGLMVLVFQEGVGAKLVGFQQTDTIDAWIPLFMFSVLFGLSMDYHVFLLSRVRERYDQSGDNQEAVAFGLRTTAGLITGAALIMVAVFSGFASGVVISNQEVGFGLAAAVFIDATLVRSVLVPASMRLLGDWNWYLPSWLGWLPDLRVEAESPAAVPGPALDND